MVALVISGPKWDTIEGSHGCDEGLEVDVWLVTFSYPMYRVNLRQQHEEDDVVGDVLE